MSRQIIKPLQKHFSVISAPQPTRDNHKRLELSSILPPKPQSLAQLTLAIQHYDKTSAPSEQTYTNRKRATSDLTQILNTDCKLGTCTVCMFGSTVNGFGTRTADIDCMIRIKGLDKRFIKGKDAINSRRVLKHASKVISQSSKFSKPQNILQARFPIMKTMHLETKLDLDIAVDNGSHAQIINSELLLKYCKSDKRVRSVGRLLSLLMGSTYLGGNHTGGLSSYAYKILLIYYYLSEVNVVDLVRMDGMRNIPDMEIPQNGSEADICSIYKDELFTRPISDHQIFSSVDTSVLCEGRLLLGFLLFYALKFDYFNDRVQINTQSSLKKCRRSWNFVIEDPIVEKDLGRYLQTPKHLTDLRFYFLFLYQKLGQYQCGYQELLECSSNLEFMKMSEMSKKSLCYSQWVEQAIVDKRF